MRWTFRLLFGLVALFIIFLMIRIVWKDLHDQPVKLGNLDLGSAKVADTVYLTTIDTIYKSGDKPKLIRPSIQKNSAPPIEIKGNGNHTVSGSGNTVGINGDIIAGIKQRHLTEETMRDILSKIPSKDSRVHFWLSGGKEGLNYANEIYNKLRQMGYQNITNTNWMDPNDYDKLEVIAADNLINIKIYPASNVQ